MSTDRGTVEQISLPKAQPAHEALAAVLRRQILIGTFGPGSKLPTERDLAPALGVSRNTARLAIRILSDQGLVQTTLGRNGGSVVTSKMTAPRNRRAAVDRWRTSFEDNHRIRASVEPLAARWAAERASATQRRSIVRLGQTDLTETNAYRELESRWHLMVAAAARESILVETITRCREDVYEEPGSVWIQSDVTAWARQAPENMMNFATEHSKVSEAIGDRDPDAAEAEMKAHFDRTLVWFNRAMQAILTSSPAIGPTGGS